MMGATAVSDETKMAAYVARLPKRDRRELSRASPQTKWIMEATAEWYGFYVERAGGLGLPTKNTLHDAALLIPRAPLGSGTPPMADPPELAAAVEAALPRIRASRRRVLVTVERCAVHGLERAARQLRMSQSATRDYLNQARQSLADILRGQGWDIPQNE